MFFYEVVYRLMITIMVCVFLALGSLRETLLERAKSSLYKETFFVFSKS